MKYLLKTVDTYRVDTVDEVEKLHQDLQAEGTFTLTGYSYKTKYIKEKGEIIGEYQVVSATKVFNDEKEPLQDVSITYEV